MKTIHFSRIIILSKLFILILLQANSAFSQVKKKRIGINFNIKADTIKTKSYTPDDKEEGALKTVVLKMSYGDYHVLNPKDAELLNKSGINIVSVDIVYTDFYKNDVQDKLNLRRLTELYFLAENVFDQSLTRWSLIEQLGYYDEVDAKKLFHGIVIKYFSVPKYTPVTLDIMLSDVKSAKLKDSTVYKFFDKFPEYTKELICVDMTGSMSPYYMELFVWLSLKGIERTLNYSFFNDGDKTPDYLKRMGDVGGIYTGSSNKLDSIVSSAYNCILGGNGGDAPENNIEAVLKGIEKFPKSKEIILVADNWADMRDYSLLSKIKIPVRVIVCGTNLYGIKTPVNPQYIDLAYQSKGSIHTIEEDILKLSEIKEGGTLEIGGEKFILKGGKFFKK